MVLLALMLAHGVSLQAQDRPSVFVSGSSGVSYVVGPEAFEEDWDDGIHAGLALEFPLTGSFGLSGEVDYHTFAHIPEFEDLIGRGVHIFTLNIFGKVRIIDLAGIQPYVLIGGGWLGMITDDQYFPEDLGGEMRQEGGMTNGLDFGFGGGVQYDPDVLPLRFHAEVRQMVGLFGDGSGVVYNPLSLGVSYGF